MSVSCWCTDSFHAGNELRNLLNALDQSDVGTNAEKAARLITVVGVVMQAISGV
jgi:hypothetical protein